jgi:hypothetical protein
MDIEFHYYMTYLIAVKAGLEPEEALTVATASQYVDDNDRLIEIDRGLPSAYRNYISQTLNILYPTAKLFRIYPLFHFIPGDPLCPSAGRKDGKLHWLNTTPDSANARLIFDAALATGDAYRIGIACHAYADTWAHQNFVGYSDAFNAMSGPVSRWIPNIGHADAQYKPDWPALVWRDERLLGPNQIRDNRLLFLDAAGALYARLMARGGRRPRKAALAKGAAELRADLSDVIGDRDPRNTRQAERIERFLALSVKRGYGGRELVRYDANAWASAAIREEVRGLRDRSDYPLAHWDPLKDAYRWADPERSREADWYRFQEAVKAHQSDAWAILGQRNFKGLELPDL